MSLAALQADFRHWLEQGDEAAAARLGSNRSAGLAVYQNNYRAQLIACLVDAFPQTLAWLGEAAFESAAAHHIDAVPPSSWSLDHYPGGFPATLAALYPRDPEIAELAQLEWLLSEIFVATDAWPLTLDMLSEVDWERATLRLVPGALTIALSTNAAAIWTALNAGEEPPAAALLPEEEALLLWRQGFTSCFRQLDADEATLLSSLADGRAFADLCAALAADRGEEAGLQRAGELLARWAGEECLASSV